MDELIIGNKTKGFGFIYAPYITYDVVPDPSFRNAMMGRSKNELRKKKIDKIFKNIPYIDYDYSSKPIKSKHYQTIKLTK